MEEQVFSVSDFVAVFNQSISYAYPFVYIEGEIENFKISKNKWVYFSLRDDFASVRFFGTIFQLPGPLEDGLKIRVKGTPFLHATYGFNININLIQPVGEGSIKKAAKLLEAKLKAEGLFDQSRKRILEYPVKSIGLITSVGSAAYHDFIKISGERWSGLDIFVKDVQVQGEAAVQQIINAINFFNTSPGDVDVIVIIRGGGSVEDLSVFNEEHLVKSVATSRIPSLVAIGHEVDISLAELAADRRCSTPTHAAETLTPNKLDILGELKKTALQLSSLVESQYTSSIEQLNRASASLLDKISIILDQEFRYTNEARNLLKILNPSKILKMGYAIIRRNGKHVDSKLIKTNDKLTIETYSNNVEVTVLNLKLKDTK